MTHVELLHDIASRSTTTPEDAAVLRAIAERLNRINGFELLRSMGGSDYERPQRLVN